MCAQENHVALRVISLGLIDGNVSVGFRKCEVNCHARCLQRLCHVATVTKNHQKTRFALCADFSARLLAGNARHIFVDTSFVSSIAMVSRRSSPLLPSSLTAIIGEDLRLRP